MHNLRLKPNFSTPCISPQPLTPLQVYLHTNCIAVMYNVCAASRFRV